MASPTKTSTNSKTKTKLNRTIIYLYTPAILLTIYILVMFFWIGPEQTELVKQKILHMSGFSLNIWTWFFYPHIILGIVALLIGPYQLTKASRKNPAVHRKIGTVYAIAIFLNVLASPYLAVYATGGMSSTIAFIILDAFWLWTTAIAVIHAKQRNIHAHQTWIKRSYAITWVFVTFRILIGPLSIVMDPSLSFPIAVYISIVINLLVVEWRHKTKNAHTLPQ
ncbi:MAG: DUF2306 domain-containing protein [Bacillus sp. (in: firmicutes)]|uniref:DUF2306 domain-containing protein n=1 Tax=Bacillus marasmi TaxID=1926279 RepID=UPI0011C76CA0|nr:DUF2306 domain-containing protein [Bacillus marasmi]